MGSVARVGFSTSGATTGATRPTECRVETQVAGGVASSGRSGTGDAGISGRRSRQADRHGYVKIRTTANGGRWVKGAVRASESFRVSHLVPAKKYSVRLRAVNVLGTGAPSRAASATVVSSIPRHSNTSGSSAR